MKLVREGIEDFLKGKSREEVIPGEDLVMFKRVSDNKGFNASLTGEVDTSYKRLVELFGKPIDYTKDGYKVAFKWVVEDDKGRVATIYDWKVTTLYDGEGLDPEELKKLESYEWHIGSDDGGYTPPSWLRNMMAAYGDGTAEEIESPPIVKDLTNFIYFYEGKARRK